MIDNLKRGLIGMAILAAVSTQAMAAGKFFELATSNGMQSIGEAEYAAIGETEISTKVLTLGDGKHAVRGVLGRALLDYAKVNGETMTITALDGYQMEIPVDDLRKYDAVIATSIDGKPLSIRDKGPAWLLYPVSDHKELDDTIYESRSVWQIKSIQVQ